jgi:ABC-type sugar transport system substrate-binding protein
MKQKKILAIIVALCMVLVFAVGCGGGATPAPAAPAPEAPATEAPAPDSGSDAGSAVQVKKIGHYADAQDSYYSLVNDALVALSSQDPETDWTVDFKMGNNTAEEQLKAVEDFITAGYDAIAVIQNNSGTTGECIAKCKEAGIPYFGIGHQFYDQPNARDAAGAVSYNFVDAGRYAGKDAIDRGVSKLINIQGFLGQGSAFGQSQGFLLAYEEAGLSLGDKADGTPWTAEEIYTTFPSPSEIYGDPALVVVVWDTGGWMTDQAYAAMQNAITSLGKDGWDGAYVHNNPMVEGAMMAMEEAGLTTRDYWLGSLNGREISWQWAKDGLISFDANQPAPMEGAIAYQMIKEYFNTGSVEKQFVYSYLTPYTKDNINELIGSLVPCSDIPAFVDGVNSDKFVWRLSDAKFVINPNY